MLAANAIVATSAANAISQVVRIGLLMHLMAVVTESSGPTALGVWIIGLTVVGILNLFGSGFAAALLNLVSKRNQQVELMTKEPLIHKIDVIILYFLIIMICVYATIHMFINALNFYEYNKYLNYIFIVLISTPVFTYHACIRSVLVGSMRGYVFYTVELLLISAVLLYSFAFNNGNLSYSLAHVCYTVSAFLIPAVVVRICCIRSGGSGAENKKDTDSNIPPEIWRDGRRYSVNQSANALAANSDSIILALLMGPTAAALYGVVHRLFALPLLILATANDAAWPRLASEFNAGNREKLARMFVLFLVVGVLASVVLSLLLFLFFRPILTLWMGENLDPSTLLIVCMAAWLPVSYVAHWLSVMMKATDQAYLVARVAVVVLIVNLCLTILLIAWIGEAGAVLGTVFAFAGVHIPAYGRRTSKLLRAMKNEYKV